MNAAFVTLADNQWASRRWRAEWPARAIGADVITIESLLDGAPLEYDAYIFVKVGQPELWQAIKDAGKTLVWDLCDPVHWFSPADARTHLAMADHTTASSEMLAADLELFGGRPVHCIPDRVWKPHYSERRIQRPSEPVRLIWYGAYQNRLALFGGLAQLDRMRANGHKFELTVFDDRPDVPLPYNLPYPVYYTQWTIERENIILAAHDIAYLPPYPGPWGRIKSNNKALTAWACGLAVDNGERYDILSDLMSKTQTRRDSAERGYAELCTKWNVEQSRNEWEKILCAS